MVITLALAPIFSAAEGAWSWFADHPLQLGTAAALLALALAALAETLHHRRVQRVRHLAFGRAGRGSPVLRAAPFLRAAGVTLAAFGLAVLLVLEPEYEDPEPAKDAAKHILVCMDSSPSMFLEDAGPRLDRAGGTKPERRSGRAGEVVQAILDRADPKETRVTVFSIYRGGIPVAEETYDKEVVRNFFDGLPMYAAFEPGPTDLQKGVAEALEYARRWEDNTAMLVIVSDGDDSGEQARAYLPRSIADVLVIGVGDPRNPTTIAGHRSKQDARSLRELASRLGGTYFDANERHLPTSLLAGLTITKPRLEDQVGLREAALASLAIGALLAAAVGPALAALGRTPQRPASAPAGARRHPSPRPRPFRRPSAAPPAPRSPLRSNVP